MPIDYGLPPGDPRAFECDEIVPVSRGGSPYDRANVDASHRCCNNWRKAKPAAVVRSIQAGVGRRGRPSCPEEFVAMAKAVERGDLQMRCSMPCKTTTEW